MFHRRKLPHWYPEPGPGCFLFVTWRLAGSLPQSILPRTPQNAGKDFVAVDRITDRAVSGPLWLKDPRIAQLVKNALLHGEQARSFYALGAWVIMPNHVHVLLEPIQPLPEITRWLKGSTARAANQLLNLTGNPFWQKESFDHWVRTNDQLHRTIHYIEHNPVAAGLAQTPTSWPWSSAAVID